jgi:hypothetical protein
MGDPLALKEFLEVTRFYADIFPTGHVWQRYTYIPCLHISLPLSVSPVCFSFLFSLSSRRVATPHPLPLYFIVISVSSPF